MNNREKILLAIDKLDFEIYAIEKACERALRDDPAHEGIIKKDTAVRVRVLTARIKRLYWLLENIDELEALQALKLIDFDIK